MQLQVGPFNLVKKLIEDHEKTTFLAEHSETKHSFVLYLLDSRAFENRLDQYIHDSKPVDSLFSISDIKQEGAYLYSFSALDKPQNLVSLKDYISKTKEFSEEKAFELITKLVNVLAEYCRKEIKGPFHLTLDSVFISEGADLVILDHSSSNFSTWLDQKNSSLLQLDPLIVSLGKIAYFIFTKRLPEGYFLLPSECNFKISKKVDEFIKGCLHQDPLFRYQNFDAIKEAVLMIKSQDLSLKPALNPTLIERPDFDPNPGHVFTQELLVAKYQPAAVKTDHIEPLLSEMVIVPEGDYSQGSSTGARDEAPVHTVHLNAYAIDKHPVTNEQFVLFLEVMGGEKDAHNNDMIRLKESRIKKIAGKFQIESGYTRHPVVGVSWYGAQAYAKWVGKRLPTEAEWEVAASSAKGELYPTGSTIEKNLANFFSSDTTVICSYPPNSIGLYDMGGNVYEWCQDWYGYNYYEAAIQEPTNPQGPLQGVYRVLRGGCWKSLKDDLRVSHRHRNNPGAVNTTYGFRCAADVTRSH